MVNSVGRSYEVVALGSAIVDMFCQVPEGYVDKLGIRKGSMQLVGPDLAGSVIDVLGAYCIQCRDSESILACGHPRRNRQLFREILH